MADNINFAEAITIRTSIARACRDDGKIRALLAPTRNQLEDTRTLPRNLPPIPYRIRISSRPCGNPARGRLNVWLSHGKIANPGLRGMKRNLALADLSWRIHQIQPDMAAKASLGTKHHVRTEEEHLRSTPDGVLCGGARCGVICGMPGILRDSAAARRRVFPVNSLALVPFLWHDLCGEDKSQETSQFEVRFRLVSWPVRTLRHCCPWFSFNKSNLPG